MYSAVQQHFSVDLPPPALSSIVPEPPNCDTALPSVASPTPAAVCSPRADLGYCLGIGNFELLSESDLSAGDGSGQVLPAAKKGSGRNVGRGRRRGRGSGAIYSSGTPSKSPIVGRGRHSARLQSRN